ncbi:MAG: DNA mismatch repair endonuclease MutL [Chloroflexota bacterium]
MPIKLLDVSVISRIAAGEVVTRPAAVVKELVENSLDAGVTEITIEVAGSGTSLIRVTDNGLGIPSAEVPLVFTRYSTSKISRLEDLDNISTLGFRGEALASIAAVADVELLTRSRDEADGYFLNLRDGVVADKGTRARSQGTTVTVRNLFRRVPARLKFLKSEATESAHVATVVSQYALCFPEVKFTLTPSGRVSLRTPGSGELVGAIARVYGAEVARKMLAIAQTNDSNSETAAVTGMVGSPSLNRPSWDYLSLFVNRRWIVSRTLAKAVESAYHGLLMTGRHPVAIVNVFLPPAEIDVNVHPAKTEIKFRNEGAVFSLVERAVRQTLVAQAPVPRIEERTVTYFAPRMSTPTVSPIQGKTEVRAEEALFAAPAIPEPPRLSLPILRVLGQVSNCYIVAEGPDGLYLIDQHAAHERVLFEKIFNESLTGKPEIQGLLEPQSLELSPGEDASLKSQWTSLAGFGFSLEPFGIRTYLVRAVPAVLRNGDWQGALRELLGGLTEEKSDPREMVATVLACHSAVKAGDSLSLEEMEALIRSLEKTSLPNTCPHGRPTLMKLGFRELEKEFGRV